MKYETGALPSRPDNRDYLWENYPKAVTPFDWEKGFDIGISLITKDQNGSGSCGGQAWAYYGEVLSTYYDKVYDQKSAKFIYAQTFNPNGGGSAGRDNCKIVKGQGWADEAVLTSYDNGKPPREDFITRSQDITEEIRENAKINKGLSYANVLTDIDSIATAIEANHGCIIGIAGSNNGTWRTEFPKPPKFGETVWWHWLYCGKAKMIDGKKYIGVKNSWGDRTGKDGWQWISEDYFNAGQYNGFNVVFEAWTLIFDEENRVKQNLMRTTALKLIELLKQAIAWFSK